MAGGGTTERVNRGATGHRSGVEETTKPARDPGSGEEEAAPDDPGVDVALDGDTARLRLTGELTEAARRPLIRAVTDLLLGQPSLARIELHLADVPFMNSAGMAVLVQIQRLAAPRAIEVPLVAPGSPVTRPLQLSGLWHRFTVTEYPAES
jgi:stage II sporulation protein AA (anti-sigma F factor antagonist)